MPALVHRLVRAAEAPSRSREPADLNAASNRDTSVLSTSSSRRAVAAINNGRPPARPSSNGNHAVVSSSHHCRSSSTRSVGWPTARIARATPSKNLCLRQASIARDAAIGSESGLARCPRTESPAAPGMSRSTSTRQISSRVASDRWMRGWRSQSAAGFRASAPAIPKQRVVATTAPSVRALCASSEISRLFPTPASPVTTSNRGLPSPTPFQNSRSWSNSRSRPTSGAR
jgi:hypothetical protein